MENNNAKNYVEENVYGNVKVVRDSNYQWGVVDLNDNIIVPFGKYAWIDGFNQGLARVRTAGQTISPKQVLMNIDDTLSDENGEVNATITRDALVQYLNKRRKKFPEQFAKWGIINEAGEEVLPVENDEVWNFFGKGRWSTKVKKDDKEWEVYFCDLNPELPDHRRTMSVDDNYDSCDYEEHYEEFAGTYAQDYAGFSDEDISDIFDGDLDAYWNID